MKEDIYKRKQAFENWKRNIEFIGQIPDITKKNSYLIIKYLHDMENGLNIAKGSKKGGRSYIRLCSQKNRLIWIIKKLETYGINDIEQTTEQQLHVFFTDMSTGKIRKLNGEIYKSACDFVKTFKAFWHWLMKVRRKDIRCNQLPKEMELDDITEDLDIMGEKAPWVYLTPKQVKILSNHANPFMRMVILFLFDSGVRPCELLRLKVSHFLNYYRDLDIPKDVSKTHEHGTGLYISGELVKEYVQDKGLKPEDNFMKGCSSSIINRDFKRLVKKAIRKGDLNDGITLGRGKLSNLSMNDIRHSSVCYWHPKYSKTSKVLHKFGWKNESRIYYYTESIGMNARLEEQEDPFDIRLDSKNESCEFKELKQQNEILMKKLFLMQQMKQTPFIVQPQIRQSISPQIMI